MIRKMYIVDENNKKVAVQLDIETFEEIEDILENYALYQFMKENEHDEKLDIVSAKEYYYQLENKN